MGFGSRDRIFTNCASSLDSHVWSFVRGVKHSSGCTPRRGDRSVGRRGGSLLASTARQSPALATNRTPPRITATHAQQPALTMPTSRPSGAMDWKNSSSNCTNASLMACSTSSSEESGRSRRHINSGIVSRAVMDTRLPPWPSNTPQINTPKDGSEKNRWESSQGEFAANTQVDANGVPPLGRDGDMLTDPGGGR